MSTATISRQSKGQPIGGEFATHDRDESDVTLGGETGDEISVWRTRYETPEAKVKAFMDELETAVGDLDSDEDWQHYLATMSKFHNYSFNNQMLIALQCPGAERVAGFKKWQELGRQVRKGERGISILAPRKARVELKDAAGNPIRDENGKPRRDMRVIGVTTATVFDISQTDGPDLPTGRQELSEEPPAGLKEDLEGAITNLGFTVDYGKMPGSALGYTTTDGSNRVVIKQGLTPGSTARVLAHELGHIAAGHVERGADYHVGPGGERGQMEVEADSISYAMLRSNGMSPEVGRANASYISGWSKRDPKSVKAAATTVSKAVKSLFESTRWQNAAPGM
jgi:antirestriction protein ArdC